ncbi:MAG: M28 family peptidase [Candidatus Woesearchaeota archaeon]
MELMPIVKELEGTDNAQRLLSLKRILKKNKIKYTAESYGGGENILIGNGNVLFVAHHDTVSGSPGANDNASAIAVLIGLAKKRKAAIVIFGEEELGYVGSAAYIEKHPLPKTVIDLELMGMGDLMAIWPVSEERPLLDKIRKGLRKAAIPFEEAKQVPAFWADFTAFRNAGLKDAWCLTLVPSSEKNLIRTFATRPMLAALRVIFGRMPRFFKCYHSPEDKSAHLSEKSLQLSLKAVVSVYDELHGKT